MVVACAVCRRCKDVYTRICFHTFPLKDEKRMEAWCSAMNLPRERVSKYWRLCSVHFTADSYKESVLTVYSKNLKKDAVPSIINMSDEEIIMIESIKEETGSSNVKENDCEKEQLKMEVVTNEGEKDYQSLENGSENEIIPVESLKILSCDKKLAKKRSSVEVDNLENDECATKLKNIKTVKWEDVSHSPSLSKAAFKEAKDSIHDLEKKLQAERVRNCRLKKIVKSFRTLMAVLKKNKFVKEERAMKLEQSMPPVAQEIMRKE